MKLARHGKREAIVRVPPVVRVSVVGVQPRAIGIAFDVEHVRIAVGVSTVWHASHITAR